ncbi:MAG: metal ABC transporter permease [Candidatus Methylacidiphilales bacterium]
MMTFLLEPFEFGFMQRALLGACLVSLACATIGVFVVLRRMAFLGDALAHTVMPGIVLAHFQQVNLFLGALTASLLSAIGIGWLSRRDSIREDTAIGIVFTGMFALGILYMSARRSFRDFTHILFGNVIGITDQDVVLLAVVATVVLGGILLLFKELELTSFDPRYAAVIGLSSSKVRFALLILCALAVVAAIQAVGVLLTMALLITPAATAGQLTRRLIPMLGVSVLVALFSCLVGLYASYYADLASGATIVLTSIGCFLVSLLLGAGRGGHPRTYGGVREAGAPVSGGTR